MVRTRLVDVAPPRLRLRGIQLYVILILPARFAVAQVDIAGARPSIVNAMGVLILKLIQIINIPRSYGGLGRTDQTRVVGVVLLLHRSTERWRSVTLPPVRLIVAPLAATVVAPVNIVTVMDVSITRPRWQTLVGTS